REQLEKLWDNEATFRTVAFVEYMYLQNFEEKNNMVAVKKYLDILYNTKYKGQAYYANAFEKYLAYKSNLSILLQQADSLRIEVYKMAQPKAHKYTIKKIEEPTVASLIEASQSGAMPLLFNVQPKYFVKSNDDFVSDKEYFLRNGLPNFFQKLSQEKPTLRIAFLGGSITKAEDQYRNQTLAYLQTLNPNAIIQGINAGVSGTGTELGACRLKEQVLQYQPDLVFIEFAVNGGSNEAMEGIVRQIIRNNPSTDICFIYTIAGEQYKQYASNQIPAKIQAFEIVANYYQLPSIHMGLYPSILEAAGKLVWKSSIDETDKIVFSKDGTHPVKAGGDLYAQAIARAFNFFKTNLVAKQHQLLAPLYKDNWENANMLSPEKMATFSKGWETITADNDLKLKQFAPWFATISKAVEAGATCTFKLKGTAVGFFDIGGPEAGQIEVDIDGKCLPLIRKAGNSAKKQTGENDAPCLVNRFNANCNNRYRGQFEIFQLEEGIHEVTLKLSPIAVNKLAILQGQDLNDIQQNPQKYLQHIFYLGKILFVGEII
ncbi:MAG: SGNH/GDSL hydrolase family protein, partial [Chitinophagaceae bacterium]